MLVPGKEAVRRIRDTGKAGFGGLLRTVDDGYWDPMGILVLVMFGICCMLGGVVIGLLLASVIVLEKSA